MTYAIDPTTPGPREPSIDPALMTGPAIGHVGLPSPDLHAVAAFDLRLAIGEVHARLARHTVEPVEAIDQVIALVREHDRRASHDGPTSVAAVVAERFQGGEQR